MDLIEAKAKVFDLLKQKELIQNELNNALNVINEIEKKEKGVKK